MANEAQVRSSLRIVKGNRTYQSPNTFFQATVDGDTGPTPGELLIPVDGRDIYFDELTTPGLAFIKNNDATNFVTLGIFDPDTGKFYPLLELLPGEGFPIRFSRALKQEWGASGTVVPADSLNYLRAKADYAPVRLLVDSFDK